MRVRPTAIAAGLAACTLAAANGHVGAGEQKNIQAAENRQSRRIHCEKHNERKRD